MALNYMVYQYDGSMNALCAINVILENNMIHPAIDKLLLAPDKQI